MKAFLSACLSVCALVCFSQPVLHVSIGDTEIESGLTTYEVGSTYVGTSGVVYFLAENTGDQDLEFGLTDAIVLSGANVDQFGIGDDVDGQTLASGELSYFSISFNPTSAGSKTATVTISSNDADFTFTINGSGLPALNDCNIPSFDFEDFQNSSIIYGFLGVEGTVAYQMPSGWQPLIGVLNALLTGSSINVRPTADVMTGSNAVEFYGGGGGTADAVTIFDCDNLYTSLRGYYKFTGDEDDEATITVSTGGDDQDNQTLTNTSTFQITSDAGSYTQFDIPILYDAQSVNSVYIHIFSATSGASTSLKIDDLTLEGVLAPEAPFSPEPPFFTDTNATGATVNWTAPFANGSPITSYTLQQKEGAGGSFSTIYTGPDLSYPVNGLTEGTAYYFQVLATNSVGDSDYSEETELIPADGIVMSNGIVTVCNGAFTDSGVDGDYGNNEDFELTIEPSEPGKRIRVTFSELDLELGSDYLMAYNGASSASPLMASLTGTSTPILTASGASGALTFQFTSDGSGVLSGWAATVSCVDPAPPSTPAPITFGTITPVSVVVNWIAPGTNGSPITGYTLEQKEGAGGSYSIIYSGSDLTHQATGLTEGQSYFFRVKATNGVGDSDYSNEATVIPQNLVQMSNGSVSACEGTFTDSGGPASNYSLNEDFTFTISPSEGGKKVSVTFNSFDVEEDYDFLSVYNGPDDSSPLAEDLTGASLPGAFTATTSGGELTFHFTSDGIVNTPGWVASISCVTIEPEPPAKPDAVTFGSVTATSAQVNWNAPADNGSAITSYTLQQKTGEGGSYSTVYTGINLTHSATGLAAEQPYFFRVKATNAEGDSEYSDEAEVVPQNSIAMTNGIATACGGTFTDSGGSAGDYADNQDFTLTIEPVEPGKKVKVSFSQFNLEDGFDYLRIYDGPNTSAPELDELTGTSLPGAYTATGSEGKLTFHFTSDGSEVRAGWLATLTCLSPPAQPDPVAFTNVTTTSATIGWTAPVDNGFAITEYTLEQKEGVGGAFAEVYSGLNLSYHATSLTAGLTYFFKVKATNVIGDSEFSDEASVTPQNPPVIQTNAGQTLDEGGTSIIPMVKLQTTDVDNLSSELTYKLTVFPAHGTVQKNGSNLSINSTFTQQDINSNLIGYAHNGSETTSDSFKFTVTDGTTTLPEATFALTITPTNDVPLLNTNTGLSVITGISKTITTAMLQGTDADHTATELTFTVRVIPAKGFLKKNNADMVVDGTFTQQDIDNGLVSYFTTHSEAGTDKFIFDLSDGFVSFTDREFNISIALSAAQPILTTNSILTVDEGATVPLAGQLIATDEDNSASEIIFSISLMPLNGQLRRGETMLVRLDTFTQAEITSGVIKYVHNGTESTSDSFRFFVTDDQFQLPEEVFTITITPVNDSPILEINNVLSLNERELKVISGLAVSDADNALNEIIYTLTAVPQYGDLKLVEAILAIGHTFTQVDINDLKLVYEHKGTSTGSDSFKFTVGDGVNLLPETTFNITVIDIPLIEQSITFDALADKMEDDANFTISASASSSLSVTFSVVSGPATLQGNTVVLTGAGAITIKAAQPGNDVYGPAQDVIRTFCSNPRKPTITLQGADSETPTLVSSTGVGNQWFKSTTPIANETGSTLNVIEAGMYNVQVTIDGCVSEMSTHFAVVVTGDIIGLPPTTVMVYPNPVTFLLTVSGLTGTVQKVTTMGATGQSAARAFSYESNLLAIPVDDLTAGLYLLCIDQGNRHYRIKFVKK